MKIALSLNRLREILDKLFLTLNGFSLLLCLLKLLFDNLDSLFIFCQRVIVEFQVLLELLESFEFMINFTVFKLFCHLVANPLLGFNLLKKSKISFLKLADTLWSVLKYVDLYVNFIDFLKLIQFGLRSLLKVILLFLLLFDLTKVYRQSL